MGSKKSIITKIAIILIIIMLVDITMPILNSQAGFLEAVVDWVAQRVFDAIAEWLVELGDVVLSGLQEMFIGDASISLAETVYLIKYSPGIIFSGRVPALDVNFIKPLKSIEVRETIFGRRYRS